MLEPRAKECTLDAWSDRLTNESTEAVQDASSGFKLAKLNFKS